MIKTKKPYFENDNFILHQGNCLEVMQEFPDDFFDMIFADPPYNLSNAGLRSCWVGRVSVIKHLG